MKTGIINYNPSLEKQILAKRINQMKQTKTNDQIAKELGYSRNYIIALNNWYQEHVKGKNHE